MMKRARGEQEGANVFSQEDAAMYDRQIRLWGADAQRALFSGRVVVVGMGALGAEVAKNLALAGVGALKLVDKGKVEESDFAGNFLLRRHHLGQERGGSCCEVLHEMAPRCIITSGDKEEKEEEGTNTVVVVVSNNNDQESHFNQLNMIACGSNGMKGWMCVVPKGQKKPHIDLDVDGGVEVSPLCAVVGGFVAQHTIRLLTGQEKIVQGVIMFDGNRCTGSVKK